MATKINPKFKDELKKYGAVNMSACYNCGTCTAVCSLSSTEESFPPREMIRLSALGIENEIKSSLNHGSATIVASVPIAARKQQILVN